MGWSEASMETVTRIHVSNLACFEDLTLRPGASTLLIGGNGAGKSTLFDLLFGVRALVNSTGAGDVGFPDWQPGAGDAEICLDVATRSGLLEYRLQLRHQPDGPRESTLGPLGMGWSVLGEALTCQGRWVTSFHEGVFRGEGLEGAIPLASDRSPLSSVRFPAESPVRRFKDWVEGMWLLRLEPQQMKASADGPEEGLYTSGENFVGWLLTFPRRKKALQRIVESVGGSVRGLERLTLERSGREWVLVAGFEHGARVDFDRLSDGQRCLIVLHAVLVLAAPWCHLLLLDEPDAHVTSCEIQPLFETIRARADQGRFQTIVASHHPQVIDILAADEPWELILGGGTVHAEPFRVDRSRGIPASRHLLLRDPR